MKKIFLLLTLMLATIFCFYGIALADGGGPEEPADDCTCFDTLPEPPRPTSGRFIWGTFTAARDLKAVPFSTDDHYNVHVTLRRYGEVHLFQTFRAIPLEGPDLCAVSDAMLKEAYKRLPCDLEVEEAFGLEGTPVIFSIRKTHEEECYDGVGPLIQPDMIRGRILIRVVPTVECD